MSISAVYLQLMTQTFSFKSTILLCISVCIPIFSTNNPLLSSFGLNYFFSLPLLANESTFSSCSNYLRNNSIHSNVLIIHIFALLLDKIRTLKYSNSFMPYPISRPALLYTLTLFLIPADYITDLYKTFTTVFVLYSFILHTTSPLPQFRHHSSKIYLSEFNSILLH